MTWLLHAGRVLALAATALLSACSGGPSSDYFVSKASFTAAGPSSGTVNASFSEMSGSLSTPPAAAHLGSLVDLNIVASNADGTSIGTFTIPSDVTMYLVTADISFFGPPTAGMVITNSNSCGTVTIHYGSNVASDLGHFGASQQGSECLVDQDAGSWTLTLTSISSVSKTDRTVYFPHGTLMATTPDGMGDTGTLNISF